MSEISTPKPEEAATPAVSCVDECKIPHAIEPAEIIVRVVKNPNHFDKRGNLLLRKAFRSAVGTDDLSVMRYSHLGIEICHRKAQEITQKNPQSYAGLASIRAEDIVAAQSEILDTREGLYCGHASIRYGVIVPKPDAPRDPEVNEKLDDKIEALVKAVTFFQNKDPQSAQWDGPAF